MDYGKIIICGNYIIKLQKHHFLGMKNFIYAKKKKIKIFSSPFSEEAVDFLKN